MDRITITSLRGGKKRTLIIRDTEGMGTGKAVDSSSPKGTLGNRL